MGTHFTRAQTVRIISLHSVEKKKKKERESNWIEKERWKKTHQPKCMYFLHKMSTNWSQKRHRIEKKGIEEKTPLNSNLWNASTNGMPLKWFNSFCFFFHLLIQLITFEHFLHSNNLCLLTKLFYICCIFLLVAQRNIHTAHILFEFFCSTHPSIVAFSKRKKNTHTLQERMPFHPKLTN